MAPLTLLAAAGSEAAASISSEGTDSGNQQQQQQQQLLQPWAAPPGQAPSMGNHFQPPPLPLAQHESGAGLNQLLAALAGTASTAHPLNGSARNLHLGSYSQPAPALPAAPHHGAQQQLLLAVLQQLAGRHAPQTSPLASLGLQGNPVAELLQALAAGQHHSAAVQALLSAAPIAAAAGPGQAGSGHLSTILPPAVMTAAPEPAAQLLQLLQRRLSPVAEQPVAGAADLLQQLAAVAGSAAQATLPASTLQPVPQTAAGAASAACAASPASARVASTASTELSSGASAEQLLTLALLERLSRPDAAALQQQQQQQHQKQEHLMAAISGAHVKPEPGQAALEEQWKQESGEGGGEQQREAQHHQQLRSSGAVESATASALLAALLSARATAGAAPPELPASRAP